MPATPARVTSLASGGRSGRARPYQRRRLLPAVSGSAPHGGDEHVGGEGVHAGGGGLAVEGDDQLHVVHLVPTGPGQLRHAVDAGLLQRDQVRVDRLAAQHRRGLPQHPRRRLQRGALGRRRVAQVAAAFDAVGDQALAPLQLVDRASHRLVGDDQPAGPVRRRHEQRHHPVGGARHPGPQFGQRGTLRARLQQVGQPARQRRRGQAQLAAGRTGRGEHHGDPADDGRQHPAAHPRADDVRRGRRGGGQHVRQHRRGRAGGVVGPDHRREVRGERDQRGGHGRGDDGRADQRADHDQHRARGGEHQVRHGPVAPGPAERGEHQAREAAERREGRHLRQAQHQQAEREDRRDQHGGPHGAYQRLPRPQPAPPRLRHGLVRDPAGCARRPARRTGGMAHRRRLVSALGHAISVP